MAPSGVANVGGRSADVGTPNVPVDMVNLGDVVGLCDGVDVVTALLLVIDGVVAFTVSVEVLIDVAVTDGDADPPTEALPQPARTSPSDVKADGSTIRVVQRLLDDGLPMSTQ